MAKIRDHWDNYDSPLETQPPKSSAEPNIDYGGIAEVAGDKVRDPTGVLPEEAKQRNIGPHGGEGH
jgi:hypothetical protein